MKYPRYTDKHPIARHGIPSHRPRAQLTVDIPTRYNTTEIKTIQKAPPDRPFQSTVYSPIFYSTFIKLTICQYLVFSGKIRLKHKA